MSEGLQPAKYGSKLLEKRILVLGGTSGIGFCIAEAAREFGATVFISGSNQSKLENAVQRIESSCQGIAKGSVSGYAQDLADVTKLESNLEDVLKFATEDGFTKLDHIVYTAGNVVGLVDMAELTTDIITANGIMRFHVPIMIGKIAPRYLKHSHESSITFTSGTATLSPELVVY